MKLRSHIEFPAFAFQKYNSRKELMAIATVSALFDLGEDEALRPAETQPEILLSDDFRTPDDAPPHLFRTADFAPFRPATDVTALARAIAPDGRPQSSWLVGIMVGDARHVLRVHGPRHWRHAPNAGWRLSAGEPVLEVPLDYYAAFGGDLILPEGHSDAGAVDVWNPVGPGVITPDTPRNITIAAPQIEHADRPITDPFERYQPQGFAPIAPVWRFREQHVGTYDDTWVKTQHPFLPPDFDPRFYNVAHPALQIDPFLRGDELVRIGNMFPGRPDLVFALPGLAFGAVATHDSGLSVKSPMVLDGVHLDLLGDVPQVRLTWRMSLPWRDGIRFMDVGPLDLAPAPPREAEAFA